MRFIWNKGPAENQPVGFFVEATDGDARFNVAVPDGFRIPDNASLSHFAASFAEWCVDKSPRAIVLRQFNCGVQGGDELAFRMPAFEDGSVEVIAKRTAEERDAPFGSARHDRADGEEDDDSDED